MGDFFHGWRRKIGVVTLLMACVFAGAWAKSFSCSDWISFSSGKNRYEALVCLDRHIVWCTYRNVKSEDLSDLPTWFSDDFRRFDAFANDPSILAKLECCGFAWIKAPEGVSALIAPFWSIVIPLTLLSAYLLLVKPRSKKPSEST